MQQFKKRKFAIYSYFSRALEFDRSVLYTNVNHMLTNI